MLSSLGIPSTGSDPLARISNYPYRFQSTQDYLQYQILRGANPLWRKANKRKALSLLDHSSVVCSQTNMLGPLRLSFGTLALNINIPNHEEPPSGHFAGDDMLGLSGGFPGIEGSIMGLMTKGLNKTPCGLNLANDMTIYVDQPDFHFFTFTKD